MLFDIDRAFFLIEHCFGVRVGIRVGVLVRGRLGALVPAGATVETGFTTWSDAYITLSRVL